MTDTMDSEAWRERTRSIYSSGDPVHLASLQEPIARTLVEQAHIQPGERVLDIGAGTGNVAIAAAKLGAQVTAIDLTPKQVELGKARSNAEKVDVDWRLGDGEALPFADNSFDVVLSNFGIIFAANPVKAATEIMRVLTVGGRALLTAWPKYSYNGKIDQIIQKILPDGAARLEHEHDWAELDHLHDLFSPRIVRVEAMTSLSEPYPSLDAWWESQQDIPLIAYLQGSLGADKFEKFKAQALELARESSDIAADGTLVRKAQYVISHVHASGS